MGKRIRKLVMNHLKNIQDWDNDLSDMIEDIKDIFVELKDEGYYNIYFQDQPISNAAGVPINPPNSISKILLNIRNPATDEYDIPLAVASSFPINDIYEYIERTSEYLSKDYILYVRAFPCPETGPLFSTSGFNDSFHDEWSKIKDKILKEDRLNALINKITINIIRVK